MLRFLWHRNFVPVRLRVAGEVRGEPFTSPVGRTVTCPRLWLSLCRKSPVPSSLIRSPFLESDTRGVLLDESCVVCLVKQMGGGHNVQTPYRENARAARGAVLAPVLIVPEALEEVDAPYVQHPMRTCHGGACTGGRNRSETNAWNTESENRRVSKRRERGTQCFIRCARLVATPQKR